LTSTALDALKQLTGNLVDFKEEFDLCNSTKTSFEINNLQTAANFTDWSFSRLVNEVEEMIEGDLQVKHSAIQKKIESCLDDDAALAKFSAKYPGINPSYLDFPLPVLIQSGSEFNLHKFQIDSNSSKL
jgi:nucleosome binding factor SPN SPT16 subunit